jgi:hypothetical protein
MDWREPEAIDLNLVTERLHSLFDHHPPSGYLGGKTAMRNALEDTLGLSELEAEELIDTLEDRGFVRFGGDPSAATAVDAYWDIETSRAE